MLGSADSLEGVFVHLIEELSKISFDVRSSPTVIFSIPLVASELVKERGI